MSVERINEVRQGIVDEFTEFIEDQAIALDNLRAALDEDPLEATRQMGQDYYHYFLGKKAPDVTHDNVKNMKAEEFLMFLRNKKQELTTLMVRGLTLPQAEMDEFENGGKISESEAVSYLIMRLEGAIGELEVVKAENEEAWLQA